MQIAITGATGLVGAELTSSLRNSGHEVRRVVRGERKQAGDLVWNPDEGQIEPRDWEGLDAVVHLAGENIAGRWNDAKKRRIRDSRIRSTRLLADTLAQLDSRPQTLVCASAVGLYGDRGDETLSESSAPGEGFLADVCQEWEDAAESARLAGVRVAHARLGMVLSRDGGALAEMLLPFKLGVAGRIGGGRQYWSWVSLHDVVQGFEYLLAHDQLSGPFNLTSPQPVTNLEFTKALGRTLHRPTILPMPAFAARLALGEMADALLLSSARVVPARLLEAGFTFRDQNIEAALRRILRDES